MKGVHNVINYTCNYLDIHVEETHNLRKNLRKCQNWICEGYELKNLRKKTATFADVACEDCEDCEASHSIRTGLSSRILPVYMLVSTTFGPFLVVTYLGP